MMCMAAFGGQFSIINKVGLQPIEMSDFLGAKSMEDFWPKATVTNEGIEANASLTSAALLGVATAVQAMAMKAAMDEYNLGKRQLKLGQAIWDRFAASYLPVEMQVSMSLLIMAPIIAQYIPLAFEYMRKAQVAAAHAVVPYKKFRLCIDRNSSTRIQQRIDALYVDVMNLAFRTAEERLELEKDRKFNERAQFLNLGRDLMATAAKYIASGVSALREYRGFMQAMSGDIAGYAGYNSEPNKPLAFSRQAGGPYSLEAFAPSYSGSFSNPNTMYGIDSSAYVGPNPYTGPSAIDNAANSSGEA